MKTRLCLFFEKVGMRNKDVTITIKRIDYDGLHELITRDDNAIVVLRFSSYWHKKGFVFKDSVGNFKKYAKAIARLNNRQNVVNIDVSDSGYII